MERKYLVYAIAATVLTFAATPALLTFVGKGDDRMVTRPPRIVDYRPANNSPVDPPNPVHHNPTKELPFSAASAVPSVFTRHGRPQWREPPQGKVATPLGDQHGYRSSYVQDKCTVWVSTVRKDCANPPFTTHAPFSAWASATLGPEFIRWHARGPEVISAIFRHKGQCGYSFMLLLGKRGKYLVSGQVVYEGYNAINELQERTWYDYAKKDLASFSMTCEDQLPVADQPCKHSLATGETQSQQWGRWVDVGPAPSYIEWKRTYPSYWLSLKNEQKLNDHHPDILGRMDYGRAYKWEAYKCKHVVFPKDAILNLMRNRVIFFFGDSHMRTVFYGVLDRLGISFPHNKVWRGDRSDYIPSHNATFAFVASYFLNTSRPSAVQMLQKGGFVVAGVGQHHASGCWSVKKHATVVEEALQDFDRHPNSRLIWMGVPAFPINLHMRIYQKRTDCRNNLRHRLLNKAQFELVRARRIPIVDVYAKSETMAHTSTDGAHFYNMVRDVWIDDIFASVALLLERERYSA